MSDAGLHHRFALRLKRTVEVFPASDGALYLMRGGGEAEFVIDRPAARERALLALLREGAGSAGELAGRLVDAGHEAAEPDVGASGDVLAGRGRRGERAGVAERLLGGEHADRYDRQLAYFADMAPGRAAELQLRLSRARVAIVGVGGLGTWTASALACAGIGHLVLVDDDRVDLSNLNRQLLYRRADVGRRKVEVAAEALGAFNPALAVTALARRVDGEAGAAAVVAGASFVVDTADSPPYAISRWLDAACVREGVPRISAGQFPPRVRIGPTYVPGRTGCLECQERAARRAFPLYDELADLRRGEPTVAATLGPASGLVGSVIGMEIVHFLTGLARPATLGAGVTIDLRDLSLEWEAVERDPECARCGATAAPAGGPPGDDPVPAA
jgi:bacteriocin biosynthesis cyclodehydratase domain-containing protein